MQDDLDLAFLGELDGVEGKIEQDLAQGAAIRVHQQILYRHVEGEGEALGVGHGAERAGDLLDDALAGDRLRVELDLSGFDLGEVEEVVDQKEQVLGARLDAAELLLLVAGEGPRQLHQERAGEADDGVERRAQFVAHAGQEPVLGQVRVLHLDAPFLEGLFEPLERRHVAGRGEHALELPVAVGEGRGVVGDDGLLARLAGGGELVVRYLPFPEHEPDAFLGPHRVGEVVFEGRADQLLARIAGEGLHLLVHVGDDAQGVRGHQGVDVRFDQRPGVELGYLQLRLELLLGGDVPGAGEDPADLAGGVHEDGGVEGDGHRFAVRRLEGEDIVADRSLLEGEAHAFGGPFPLGEIGGEEGADELVPGAARQDAHGFVDVRDRHGFVDRDQTVHGRLDEAPVVGALFGELALEAGLLGDVPGAREDPPHGPLLVFEDRGVEGDELLLAVLAVERELVVGDGPLVQGQADPLGGPFGVGEIAGERRADQFPAGVAGHAAHGFVHVGDVQHRIDGDQAVQRGLDEAAVVGPLFDELALEAGLLRDVPGAGEYPAHGAQGVLEDRGIERDDELPAVPGGHGEGVVRDDALVEGLFHSGIRPVAVHEVVDEGGARELLPGIARHLAHAGIDVGDEPRGIHGDQAVDGGLDQTAVVGFRLPEPLLQLLLLRDVPGRGEHALQPPLGVAEGGGVVGDDGHMAGPGEGRELVVGDLALAQHLLDAFLGPLGVGEVVLEGGADQLVPGVARQGHHLFVHVGDDAQGVRGHQGVDVRFDQGPGVELGGFELLRQADFLGDVLGDEQVPDGPAQGIAARGDDDPGRELLAALAAAVDRALPFAVVQGRVEDLPGLSGLDVLVGVEDGGVRLADHLFGLVAVKAAGPLVPQQDLAVEVLADDGILGR